MAGTGSAIPKRIDRLPMSRELWRILMLAGVAWLIESYDIGIVGNVLPSLQHVYPMSASTVGLVVTAALFGLVHRDHDAAIAIAVPQCRPALIYAVQTERDDV